MARVYSIPFQQLTLLTQKQDLWAITTGDAIPAVIEEIELDPVGSTIAELAISLNLFTGSYDAGSDGSSATPARHDPADAAASFTVELQNSTQTSTGSGSKLVWRSWNWQLVNGLLWQPQREAQAYLIPVSSCCVVSLDSVPSALVVAGNVIVREGLY